MPDTALHADAHWRAQERLVLPPLIRDWLADPGSLTARLRGLGPFRVAPSRRVIGAPDFEEQHQLGQMGRQRALIREVTLLVHERPVVEARSVLPLTTLAGANRGLAHMGSRSWAASCTVARRPDATRCGCASASAPLARGRVGGDNPGS